MVSLIFFTIIPLIFLSSGILGALYIGIRERDYWIPLLSVFLVLMGIHQSMELYKFIYHDIIPGPPAQEIPETLVNILGSCLVLYLGLNKAKLRIVSRRHAQQEADLAAQVQKHRAILDATPDGIVVADGETGRILEVNDEACRLFGMAKDDLVDSPRSIHEVFDIASADGGKRSGCIRIADTRIARDDGSAVPVDLAGRPAEIGGQRVLVLFLRDIGQQKERERKLLEAEQRAEEANATKTRFLANMSHELRTPLNAIIGFSEVIRDRVFGNDNDKYASYAGDIHESGQHLLELVNDLLDMAKLDQRAHTLQEESVDIAQVMAAAAKVVQHTADARGVGVDRHDPGELPRVYGDPRALRQVLINLMSNAVKFSPPGGSVHLRARLQDDGLVIEVADEGPGIAADDLARVMQPFQQAGSRLSRDRQGGTGLGLALSAKLMELHGGSLTLDSTPGHGTTAIVSLPADRLIALAEHVAT